MGPAAVVVLHPEALEDTELTAVELDYDFYLDFASCVIKTVSDARAQAQLFGGSSENSSWLLLKLAWCLLSGN